MDVKDLPSHPKTSRKISILKPKENTKTLKKTLSIEVRSESAYRIYPVYRTWATEKNHLNMTIRA